MKRPAMMKRPAAVMKRPSAGNIPKMPKQRWVKMYHKKTMKGALKNNHSHGKQICQFGGKEWSRECLYGIMDRAIKRLEDEEMTEGEAKTWCTKELPPVDVD